MDEYILKEGIDWAENFLEHYLNELMFKEWKSEKFDENLNYASKYAAIINALYAIKNKN